MFSRTKGETEYGLKAIPLGGYISMSCMFPPQKSVAVAEDALAEHRVQGGRTATTGVFQTLVQDARTASADGDLRPAMLDAQIPDCHGFAGKGR